MKHFHYQIFLFLLLCNYTIVAQIDSLNVPAPKSFVSQHEILIRGKSLHYEARAEESYLRDEKSKVTASIWSVSYSIESGSESITRPVTFIFNGGPGSASLWLHMGVFGPQLVQVPSEADEDDGAAPFAQIANPEMLLDLTDLVFIDPVGTGFSRALGTSKDEDFWTLEKDASSLAQFIRQWVVKNKRWNAPKYLAGESFGTMRAVTLAKELEGGGQNMALNGLILISQALDYQGSTSVHDNIASFLTYLPTMAAIAWYHKKAGQMKSLENFLGECRQFTLNEYAPALYRGSMLNADEKKGIAEKLSSFIGLDAGYILRSDLQVLCHRFQKQLLSDKGLVVGRLDGRFMGEEADLYSEGPHLGDPASYQISAAYTAALNDYLLKKLMVEMDRPYLTSNSAINRKWKWRTLPEDSSWEPSYVNVARQLADLMRRNKDLKVMVACGYYDLITPFFDAELTFSRHGIPSDRIEMSYFEAGHMMYTHEPDRKKLVTDIRRFLAN